MTAVQSIGNSALGFVQSVQRKIKSWGKSVADALHGPTQPPAPPTNLSPMGQMLGNLQQLKDKDPNKLKQVAGQIAAELQTASLARGVGSARALADLAGKFRAVAETGDLTPLQSGLSVPQATRSYNRTGAGAPAPTFGGAGVNLDLVYSTISTHVAQAMTS